MIIRNVINELATRLDTITGLQVYAYPVDTVQTSPVAVFGYPERKEYDQTYGRGMDKMSLDLFVMVMKPYDRSAMNNLIGYADGSGANSVKAVLESGTYTAFDVIQVVDVEFDVIRIGSIDFATAEFTIMIAGQGA
jgi:hypothetical protein